MAPERQRATYSECGPAKAGIRRGRLFYRFLVPGVFAFLLLFGFGADSCPAQPSVTGAPPMAEVAPTGADPVKTAVSREAEAVASACRQIYQGNFEAAKNIAKKVNASQYPQIAQIEEIIRQYEDLSQHRAAAKAVAFNEQMAELEKLKASVDLTRMDRILRTEEGLDSDGAPAPKDPNEPNDLPDVLLVITRATEFADDKQKTELLSSPFVVKVLQTAIDRSVLLEAEGRWLDAYTSYYYWLQAIDPNSKGYSDHADELLDKAGIAASFQNSPCETRQERYEGVAKRMFERAIEALNLHYVNTIDYRLMATKAIKRCDQLAQVLAIAFVKDPETAHENSIAPPEPDKVTAWSVALKGLLDEIEATPDYGKGQFLTVLDNVLALNDATVALPHRPLVAHFSEAALATLDPYTVMVWPRQVQDFEKLMMNEFTGIGIEISKPKGQLTVGSLLPDTPAYHSGLDAGDVIEAVDDVPTKDMSLMCAVKKITGPKGTKVALTVRRPGAEKTQNISITRDRITVPTIRGWQRTEAGSWLYMVDEANKVGYVRITSFSGDTADDFDRVLRQLEKGGLKGLIMDLRFNTGGLLDSAVQISDDFIDEGLIVRTQPREGMIPSFQDAHRRGTHPNYPLVILINAGSASASEIVAGALADKKYERAILVGTRTHGKGSVQGITPYPGGGAHLKYTMAYYHLPSGQRVKSRDAVEKEGSKDWGVGPNVELELTSNELKDMLDVQRDNDVLVQAHRNGDRDALHKRAIAETLKVDAQLAVGLLVVKTKLIEAGTPILN